VLGDGHLDLCHGCGHALIGRALYLPEGCAADEEHRELAGVPEEVMFATKPRLAGNLLDRAHALGIRAAFVAGDEVYSGRQLRCGIRQRGMSYLLAVRASHVVTTGSGRTVTAAGAARMIPARAWHRMRTGSGTKGTRHYDWAMLQVTSDDTPRGHNAGHSVLLARRHRYTGQLSFCRCWTPGPVSLSRLIAIASARWRIEMVFTQLAKRAVRACRRGREHVADLDLVVGDDDSVDEQFGQLPSLRERGRGKSGPDGLAECLDAVGDDLQLHALAGGGVQLALLGRQRGLAAVQFVAFALEFSQPDDLGEVGVQQPLLLAVELAQGLADGALPGVELLGQPGSASRPA